MSKRISISRCRVCPHYQPLIDADFGACRKEQRTVERDAIPDWCPLDDDPPPDLLEAAEAQERADALEEAYHAAPLDANCREVLDEWLVAARIARKLRRAAIAKARGEVTP